MTVLVWPALAAALLLWPGPRAAAGPRHRGAAAPGGPSAFGRGPRASGRGGRSAAPGPSRPGTAGQRIAAPAQRAVLVVTTAAGCVASFGPGRGVLVAAAVLAAAVPALGRLAARPSTAEADVRLPLCLDLAAAALRAGQPPATALALAAPAASPPVAGELERVATLLRLGAEPAEAWRSAAEHPALGAVARIACRSATSGARLARALEATAADLRADATARAVVVAHRAGIRAMAPLGACFLPAFLCVGIVPVVIGIARTAFSSLP